jgi:hypothetical protein
VRTNPGPFLEHLGDQLPVEGGRRHEEAEQPLRFEGGRVVVRAEEWTNRVLYLLCGTGREEPGGTKDMRNIKNERSTLYASRT